MEYKDLDWVRPRLEEISAMLADPKATADRDRWLALMKEYNQLKPIQEALIRIQSLKEELSDNQELLDDKDFEQLAKAEIDRIKTELQNQEEALHELLIQNQEESRGVIMEIRSGAGGEEAALFAAMLVRMYLRYAEKHGWATEILQLSDTEMGGMKEAVFSVSGADAMTRLEGESGVHRIQRIPVTESNGKRQTSTATVAVLSEASDVDVDIRQEDLRIDVFRASGHGGQYINKTDSAVRITHLPTGIVATCQDEKSQLKNKEKAMSVLRARIYDQLQRQQQDDYAADRKNKVGTGDRSERIRTYNFNDGRITDHRLGKTIYSVESFLDGDMDVIIDEIVKAKASDQLGEGIRKVKQLEN
ncbi:MAG: peptide chain release factor 1 [Clostridia bacterium]|nr:peptide chain release factor 1 [Clostridia bacterium]